MTRMSVRAAWAAVGLVGAWLAVSAHAGDEAGVQAKAAFGRLKSLAGEWKCEAREGGHVPGKAATILYRVTANGSTVMETLFPGTDHEMVSMYHLDGDDLKMTHYCAIGN